ncbi:hypothetical protein N7455_006196 [Penicillium solitum]|uniref:uncharacterized protein n=1 Tax=Penicillium solitum TaxID=60172 RepID=UPI0032C42D84|nr:hypothetical protein N7455_006196 [Penicillium solitum]
MGPLILSLVRKLYREDIKDPLIEHCPYHFVIDAVGGEKDFAEMALNAIDSRVLAMQGKVITVEMLDSIRLSQMQDPDPWPQTNGGYCDIITDSRDMDYWRGYVGQASVLAKFAFLNIVVQYEPEKTITFSQAGYRHGNFIRLWIIEFPPCTQISTKEAFENVLEMSFTLAFQTLPPSVLETYFGTCPEGSYSTLRFNVVPPLMQSRELAPRVRGEFTKLLENSDDPEIREWPSIRAQQKHKPNTSEENLVQTQRCPRLRREENISALHTAVRRVIEFAEMDFWPTEEKVPWAPLDSQIQPLDLKAWFEEFSKEATLASGDKHYAKSDLAIPIGTTSASVGIVLDSVPSHTYGEISLPWGLRESGFSVTNSLIWFANFQKYKLIPGSFQVSTPRDAGIRFFSTSTQDLIEKSNLRLILLCGKLAEKVALTEQDQKHNFILELQGVRYECWLRLRHNAIERIFVRSPAPLITLWWNKGPAAVKISTFSGLLALVLRGWDDERSKRIDPLKPELVNINPTLRIWLERLGFKEDYDVCRLAECTAGSLRLGFLVLLKALPRAQKGKGPRKVPQSKIRRRGVITLETMEKVRLLLRDIQEKLTSVPETKGGKVIKPTGTLALPEGTILVDEDLIIEAVEQGSATVTESDSKEERLMTDRLQKETPQKTEVNLLAYRKSLKLLIGYYFKGHESKKGEVSTYQFNVQQTTFRIHKAPPNQTMFFVKGEVVPVGEKHPHVYATTTTESDPGMRFSLRVSLRDDKGQDSFVGYATSSK